MNKGMPRYPEEPDVSTARAYAEWLRCWFGIRSASENAILIGESLWERRR